LVFEGCLFAGLCNVPDVCVRRGLGCVGVRLFNIMAYYRTALVCGLVFVRQFYNVALCYLAWGFIFWRVFLLLSGGAAL